MADLPELSAEESVAERLVLLAHYGADFTIWGEKRRVRYWDALAERVKAATFAGPRLADWWERMSHDLPTAPRNAAERADVAALLATPDGSVVVKILRKYADVLVLRVRVIAETRRATWDGPLGSGHPDPELLEGA